MNIFSQKIRLRQSISAVFYLTCIGLLLALTPCAGSAEIRPSLLFSANPSAHSLAALNDSVWRLTSWEHDNRPMVLDPRTALTVRFEDDQVRGSGGCNSFAGSYRATGDNLIIIGELQASQRACIDAVAADRESRFFEVLSSVRHFAVLGSGELVLSYDGSSIRGKLIFTRMEEPKSPTGG